MLRVAALFDEDLAKRAWNARIQFDSQLVELELVAVCREILLRVPNLLDERSKQLIGDALRWVIQNPSRINYNCTSKEELLNVAPNLIGFQSVMFGIAARTKKSRPTRAITIDQQTQFNKAQRTLAEFYAGNNKREPWLIGVGLPKMDLTKIPDVPLTFCSGDQSIGLELVDVYLWIFKRLMEGKELAPELTPFVRPQLSKVRTDDITLDSIKEKWSEWFAQLSEPNDEQVAEAKELLAIDENRRLHAVSSLGM